MPDNASPYCQSKNWKPHESGCLWGSGICGIQICPKDFLFFLKSWKRRKCPTYQHLRAQQLKERNFGKCPSTKEKSRKISCLHVLSQHKDDEQKDCSTLRQLFSENTQPQKRNRWECNAGCTSRSNNATRAKQTCSVGNNCNNNCQGVQMLL